jgi:excinuclease UvrABC nuclease subunit
MKVQSLTPKPDKKIEFSFRKYKFVPAVSGCYVLTNFFDDILYIGLTVDLKRRIQEHLSSKEKTQATIDGKAYWFHFVEAPNEMKLQSIERGWLNQYELSHGELPKLNRAHSPV